MKPETEKRLVACVEKTSENVSGGMAPNAAVVKAARDTQLRDSEIDLVVRAYNTGATNKQRMSGKDPWEKSADFTLADAGVVRQTLFPQHEKQAADAGSPVGLPDTTVSPDYAISPETMLERLGRREKKAHNINWRMFNGREVVTPEPYPRDPREAQLREYAAGQRANHAFNVARMEKTAAIDRLRESFSALGEYFAQLDCTPLPVVKRAAATLYGERKTNPVFTLLQKHYPHLEKLAVNRDRTGIPVSPDNPGLELMIDVVQAARNLQEKTAALKEATYRLPDTDHLRNPVERIDIYTGSVLDEVPEKQALSPFSALGVYGMASRALSDTSKLVQPPDQKELVQQQLSTLQDPEHDAKLNEINAEATLHDLLANDEVISGYDPDEVTGAYNEISQMAPAASSNRMIAQSLLRKRLAQGNIDTFDMNQLLDLEKKIRQTQPNPGIKGVANDGSVL